jgi:hypothetical protein
MVKHFIIYLLLVCSPGSYGPSCESKCANCREGAACHHVTGNCPAGCAVGFIGERCNKGELIILRRNTLKRLANKLAFIQIRIMLKISYRQ